METIKGKDAELERGDAGRFTGTVWINPRFKSADGTDVHVVSFDPGARTHWHSHPGGQFLVGLAGRGRARSRDGAGETLEPGDMVYVEPGEVHFHGGSPDSPLSHVAVNRGGAPDWLEPVTDEEYGAGF